ncbi:MAG: hypothetical protein M3P27_13680 [Acidobacteriota bacterium]|nr:hypothetical protein [Acidobacteriota bacterium]
MRATHAGEHYMDVGTLAGYRAAQEFLQRRTQDATPGAAPTESLEAA